MISIRFSRVLMGILSERFVNRCIYWDWAEISLTRTFQPEIHFLKSPNPKIAPFKQLLHSKKFQSVKCFVTLKTEKTGLVFKTKQKKPHTKQYDIIFVDIYKPIEIILCSNR